MAGQLCNAIVGLERLKIVHSDLSPANIVIGKQSDDDVHCVLIDYDGFFSPDVPKLPRQYDGKQLRMLGSPGYQHPSLARRIKSDRGKDDTLFVANDRFALGVLCFELMVWTEQVSKGLVGRTQLIDEDELANGRLVIPDAVKPVWPEGLKLLEESVAEPDVNSLPNPEDWLRALGFLGADWRSLRKDWATTAFLKIYRRRGNQAPVKHKLIHFEGKFGQGVFEKVDARLADVVYTYKNESNRCAVFSLKIKSPNPVLIKRDGITKNLGVKPDEIEIGPGDQVLTDDWILEFQDASLGTNW
jgi:serine/threonine protein kinase